MKSFAFLPYSVTFNFHLSTFNSRNVRQFQIFRAVFGDEVLSLGQLVAEKHIEVPGRALGLLGHDLDEEAGVGRILYQRQYPRSVVETVARDMGAEAVEFDPLGEDVIATIDSITSLIIRK